MASACAKAEASMSSAPARVARRDSHAAALGLSERKRQPKFAVPQKGISPQIGFDRSALADEAGARAARGLRLLK